MSPVEKPGGMEKQGEWSLRFCVVIQKVLSEYFLDGGCVLFVETTVGHGTRSSSNVFDGSHWNFPHAWMRLCGTRLNSTSMRLFVVKGVWPRGVRHRHGTVVNKSVAVKHPEHGVAAHSQEGGSHAFNILWIDASISDQHLSHPDHLVGPLFLIEIRPVRMGHSVGGHFMAIGIQILHMTVVSPLVGNVKCCLNRTSIGIISFSEQILEELFVESVDSIIEG